MESRQDYLSGVHEERVRIWEGVERMYDNSHKTRTPIYQDRMYEYLKNLLWPEHPPQQFRDRSNGE